VDLDVAFLMRWLDLEPIHSMVIVVGTVEFELHVPELAEQRLATGCIP
jgi:hypothetical protein